MFHRSPFTRGHAIWQLLALPVLCVSLASAQDPEVTAAPVKRPVFAEVFLKPSALNTTDVSETVRIPAIQANVVLNGGSQDPLLNVPACVYGTYKAPPEVNLKLRAKVDSQDWKLFVPGYDAAGEGGTINLSNGVSEDPGKGRWYWRGALQLSRNPAAAGDKAPDKPPTVTFEVYLPGEPEVIPDKAKVSLRPSDVWLLAGGEAIGRPAVKTGTPLPEKEIQIWQHAGGGWKAVKASGAGALARGFAARRRELSSELPLVLILKDAPDKLIGDWAKDNSSLLKQNPWQEGDEDGAPFICRGAVWWQGEWDAERNPDSEGEAFRTAYHQSLTNVLDQWLDWQDKRPSFNTTDGGEVWIAWVQKWQQANTLEKHFPRLAIVQLPSVDSMPVRVEPFVRKWGATKGPENFWTEVRYAQAQLYSDRLGKSEQSGPGYSQSPRELLYSPFARPGDSARGWISASAIESAGGDLAIRMNESKPPLAFFISNEALYMMWVKEPVSDDAGTFPPLDPEVLKLFEIDPPDALKPATWDQTRGAWKFEVAKAGKVRVRSDDGSDGLVLTPAGSVSGAPATHAVLPAVSFSLPDPSPSP